MNKNQLTAHAAAEASVTRAPAHRLVGAVFPAIADAHARDDTVAIARIGKYDVRSRPAHIERNPQTGDAGGGVIEKDWVVGLGVMWVGSLGVGD